MGIDFYWLFTQCYILDHREEMGAPQCHTSTVVGALMPLPTLLPEFCDFDDKTSSSSLPSLHQWDSS